MMIRRHSFPVSVCLLIAIFVFGHAREAHAAKGDVFFGYSRTGSDIFYPNTGGLNGWQGAVHVRLMPFIGIEGDVAHYGLGANSLVPRTTTFLVGPKASVGFLGFRIFAHGLLGGGHSSNDHGISGDAFTYAVGGGIDLPLAPYFGWRFAADRLSAPSQSPGTGTEGRFSTGIVFRF